jgi:acetyl esterase
VPRLHPYSELVLERRRDAKVPDFSALPPEGARALMRAMVAAAPPPGDLPPLVEVSDFTIDGPQGSIPVRHYLPKGKASAVLVYFHAGGWVIGDLDTGDASCRRIAGGANVEVISVDYRLAPEHPWPQPLDDCYAVLEWAAARGDLPIFVMGESAGGNLSAACAIRARDAGGPALAGHVVIYGVMDHDLERPSYRALGDKSCLLTTADMAYFWDHYCASVESRATPLLSPLRIPDAAGLPPLFLAVGDADVLHDEGVAYAEKLRAAGVPVTLRVDPGMLHGYFGMTEWAEPARETVAAAIGWIGSIIGQP